MVGQVKLNNLINSFTLDTLPKSLILYGDEGCGKHTLSKIIADKFHLELMELEELSTDTIIDINLRSNPIIYLINGDKLTIKQQNILLKTIEEPLKNIYIILYTTKISNIIDTILNRCYLWEFEDYKEEDLINFIPDKYKDNNEILKIIKTPGKLKQLNSIDFNDLYSFCNKFVDKIDMASLTNTLTISKKINYKDDYTKYDLNLFLNLILYLSSQKYIENKDNKYLKIFELTQEYKNKLSYCIYNKEYLFLNYLINLWYKVR